MKFTICDDTIKDLNELDKILQAYVKTNNTAITIEKYSNPHELIENVSLNPLDYHIFFLDIVMPINGIDTAKKIKELREDAIIIYTTTSKEFAVDAFGVRAYDYLMKPLEQEQVFNCITRLLNELKFSQKAFCKIKSNDLTITSINIKEIMYIESINRRIKICLKNGDVITSTTLHLAWDSQVSRSAPTMSITVFIAVSNPIVYSVAVMSLSIVQGIPIEGIP